MTKSQLEARFNSYQVEGNDLSEAEVKKLFLLSNTGVWAYEIVMPILRKLPPDMEVNFKLDGAKIVSTPDKRPLKDVLEPAFKLCPQAIP